jgi:RNA 3'-terminal phosphate cyclase (ATP)
MNSSITLDGSQGEGGGQILRTALALSVVTGRPFRIHHIRSGRPKPGLMRQHLACVEAAARIGTATVEGAALGSQELTFNPGTLVPGHYTFRIASAGSTMLLLQTVLPPLLLADTPSELVLEGGTHNPFAPPFPFIQRAFLPLVRRIGFDVEAELELPGFHPNGGGRSRVTIRPALEPSALNLDTPSRDAALSAVACLVGLPGSIADRELAVVRQRLSIPADRCTAEAIPGAIGPGNSLHVIADSAGCTNVFTGFGAPRIRSEQVAVTVIAETEHFLSSGACVEEHLADQLLLPLVLGRGGRFITTEPSNHTRTNIEVIHQFLPHRIQIKAVGPALWCITVQPVSQ